MIAEVLEPDKVDDPSGWTFTPRIVGTAYDGPAWQRSEPERLLDALGVTGLIRRMAKAGDKGPPSHAVEPRDRATAYLARVADAGSNTWLSLSGFDTSGSGEADHVIGVNAFSLDLDDDKVAGGREGVWRLLERISDLLGVQPRAIVDSGHGLQVHYVIDDVAASWEPGDDAARQHCAATFARVHRAVRHLAAQDGGNLDTVDGIERLWRAPGSTNSKPGREPVSSTLLQVDLNSEPLTLDDLDAAARRVLDDEPERAVVAPRAPGPYREPADSGDYVAYERGAVQRELTRLDELQRPWREGAGWDSTTYAVACTLLDLADSSWTALTREEAADLVREHAPRDDAWGAREVEAKLVSAARTVTGHGRPAPELHRHTFTDPTPASITATPTDQETPRVVDDVEDSALPTPAAGSESELAEAHLVDRVRRDVLGGRFCWSPGLGWLRWDRRRWAPCAEAQVLEAVRRYFIRWHSQEALAGAPSRRLADLSHLLSRAKITAVVALARGVVQVDTAAFDAHPHLLNVDNGVIDLRDGSLLAHDPELLLTKVTSTNYTAGAEHQDWSTALRALEPEVADWMQVRLGQASTGETPPDDLMLVNQGGGANGKTNFLGACSAALGEHAVLVSDRVLLASPDAHPTEVMELRGARLALIEETPEARRLSVARLKKVVGTPTITARLIRQDSVTFAATHSLLLTSNYRPVIEESDHGTWRRLALVPWPYRFRPPGQPLTGPEDRHGDPGLRQRLRHDPAAATAVLAWLVRGAVRYYAAGSVMPSPPAAVVAATRAWRTEADLVLGFLDDQLEPAQENHVASSEMLAAFNDWLVERGHRTWTDRTFAARFGDHADVTAAGIIQGRARLGATTSRQPGRWPSKLPDRFRAWLGVRFRTESGSSAERGAEQYECASGTAGTATPDERRSA